MDIDNDMINNLKNTLGSEKVDEALSQISPEMIENFSKMLSGTNYSNCLNNYSVCSSDSSSSR